MKPIRYRTESFSGLQERYAAEVMAFETFELGNTDILETLANGLLHDRGDITNKCRAFIDELNRNGFVDDMPVGNQVSFMQDILAEICKVTGVEVKYALWLADKAAVTDRKWYGRDMEDEDDFECYEIGDVVLSDLGYDGTLYGYTEMTVSLEERIERLQDRRADIINQRERPHLTVDEAARLDELYLAVDGEIQEIQQVLDQKTKRPLTAQIQSAAARAADAREAHQPNNIIDPTR